jgi:predicted metalloprotease with PDZ domain
VSRVISGGATFALHAALILAAVASCAVPQIPPPPIEREARGEPAMEITLIATSAQGTLTCPYHYDGVGFKHNWSGVILGVAPTAPADRAGFTVGDQVRGFEMLDQLKAGDWITLERLEGERWVKHRMPVETICQEIS